VSRQPNPRTGAHPAPIALFYFFSSSPKTLELRPELTITTLALTPILEASEDTARWMECMTAKAASWVEQVNAAAASDPSFAACQLPLRHGDFVCWRTEPDGQGPVRELAVGRVAICLAEEVAVHRMTRVDERSSRTSARRGESVRLQSAALPTVEWVTRPRLYRAETMLTSRWEERKVGEVTVQMDPAWRPEDWHSTRLPPPLPHQPLPHAASAGSDRTTAGCLTFATGTVVGSEDSGSGGEAQWCRSPDHHCGDQGPGQSGSNRYGG
jgi:hypothetical protein